MSALLEVHNLRTYFFTKAGLTKAVRGIDFTLEAGETLALVGESGCGKSITALSLLHLVPPPGKVVDGQILFRGEDLRLLPETEMRRIRGNQIAMVFQEPMTALNPVFNVGEQIAEVLRIHQGLKRREALQQAATLLHQVGISSPERRCREYPHQLSGGMRQRVVIAMALACRPRLLIADEPTTALDVTIQAQIMHVLDDLQSRHQMAMLLITHDLGVVAETADKVAIMHDGLIMEYAPVTAIFDDPRHPYTRSLLNCLPKIGHKQSRLAVTHTVAAQTSPTETYLDRCPPPFAPEMGKLPPMREVTPGHLVRCWRDA
jgi:oligopeptide/dipeptide ABC transporter ATP-binding protein